MQLADYLTRNNLTQAQFAELVGVRQPSVARFIGGSRLPAPEVMRRIMEVTHGAVSPNDFILAAAIDAQDADGSLHHNDDKTMGAAA